MKHIDSDKAVQSARDKVKHAQLYRPAKVDEANEALSDALASKKRVQLYGQG